MFLISPMFVIIVMSFSADQYYMFENLSFSLRWYEEFINDPKWINSFQNSLMIGFFATLLSLIVGVPASLWVHDNKRYQNIIMALVLLPIVVPPLISAVSWYFSFSYIEMYHNLSNIVIGHFIMGVPFVVICTLVSLEGSEKDIENIGMLCGANKYQVFLHIQLPIILPGILSGTLLAFMASFDDLIISLFLSDFYTRTVALEMWSGLRENISPVILVVTTITTIISLLTMIIITVTDGRYSISHNSKT